MKSFKQGDKVKFIRIPTTQDWKGGSSSNLLKDLNSTYTVSSNIERGGNPFVKIKELADNYFPECVLQLNNEYEIF